MKFTCNTKGFAAAATAAAKIADRNSVVPIHANVLITAKAGTVTLLSTDLETTFEQKFSAEVSANGSTTVNAKLLASYLDRLPVGIVSFEAGNSLVAHVEFEKNHVELFVLPVDDFPKLPKAKPGSVHFQIAGKELHTLVDGTAFAAAKDEARPTLTTILIEIEDGEAKVVATDGFRLATNRRTIGPGNDKVRYMVPSKCLHEVARHANVGETVSVTALGAKGNQLRFVIGDMTFTVRLMDGQYPDYENVIPKQYDTEAVIRTEEIIRALKRAQLIAEKKHTITFDFDNGEVTLGAASDLHGTAHEVLDCELQGPPVRILFSADSLIDALSHMTGASVTFKLAGPLSPATLTSPDDANAFHVVMPMREAA
jgi:DNA polymerase-3 subunit beta